jgi:hypothetical protein
LKPEQWGSLLVQEKYKGEMACDKRKRGGGGGGGGAVSHFTSKLLCMVMIIAHPQEDDHIMSQNMLRCIM